MLHAFHSRDPDRRRRRPTRRARGLRLHPPGHAEGHPPAVRPGRPAAGPPGPHLRAGQLPQGEEDLHRQLHQPGPARSTRPCWSCPRASAATRCSPWTSAARSARPAEDHRGRSPGQAAVEHRDRGRLAADRTIYDAALGQTISLPGFYLRQEQPPRTTTGSIFASGYTEVSQQRRRAEDRQRRGRHRRRRQHRTACVGLGAGCSKPKVDPTEPTMLADVGDGPALRRRGLRAHRRRLRGRHLGQPVPLRPHHRQRGQHPGRRRHA